MSFLEKSHFKWGLVNHALCSAIRELLKNHHVFVCQLENLHRHGNLSLQKLWYYVSPIMSFMEILALIIKSINKSDLCGSAIMNLLFEKVLAYSGDAKLQELIFYLAQAASKPYLSMLEDWIYKVWCLKYIYSIIMLCLFQGVVGKIFLNINQGRSVIYELYAQA